MNNPVVCIIEERTQYVVLLSEDAVKDIPNIKNYRGEIESLATNAYYKGVCVEVGGDLGLRSGSVPAEVTDPKILEKVAKKYGCSVSDFKEYTPKLRQAQPRESADSGNSQTAPVTVFDEESGQKFTFA